MNDWSIKEIAVNEALRNVTDLQLRKVLEKLLEAVQAKDGVKEREAAALYVDIIDAIAEEQTNIDYIAANSIFFSRELTVHSYVTLAKDVAHLIHGNLGAHLSADRILTALLTYYEKDKQQRQSL